MKYVFSQDVTLFQDLLLYGSSPPPLISLQNSEDNEIHKRPPKKSNSIENRS
jgi:hypothetical protein